jgi:hypothetical protein
VLAPNISFTQDKLKPAQFPELARTISVRLPGGISYPKGTVLGMRSAAQVSEVQTVTIGGTGLGGTFTLGVMNLLGSYDYTAALAYNATAATVQAALEALLGVGNVTVTGSAGGPYAVAFGGDYANIDVPLMLTTSALTGTTPTVAVAETTKGAAGGGTSAAAYASGNSDGTQIPSCVLESSARTDGAGRLIGYPAGGLITAPAFSAGDFLVSDLVGFDANALSVMGRLVAGSAIGQAGAIVRLR